MKRVLKWAGLGLLVVLAVVVTGVGTVSCVSDSRIAERYEIDPDPVEVPTDEASLAEGERLYLSRGCGDCHAADGGGRVIMDAPPARVVGANLTRLTRNYRSEDWARAVRHGVARDGHPIILMPAHEYRVVIRDSELGKIIAHVRTLPPVERDLPPTEVRVLGNLLHIAGALPLVPAELIDHDTAPESPPEPTATAEYGANLIIACFGCHGEGLSGGPIPGAPPELGIPANLTPHESGLAAWTEEDFFRAMREGKRPDGAELDPLQMPWRNFQHMTDTEISALWAHLRTVPAREHGLR